VSGNVILDLWAATTPLCLAALNHGFVKGNAAFSSDVITITLSTAVDVLDCYDGSRPFDPTGRLTDEISYPPDENCQWPSPPV
jgi:hypothetical protein